MNTTNYTPRNPEELISYISLKPGQTKSSTLNAIVGILGSSGITIDSLHSEHSRPLIVAICGILHEEMMKKYIDDILNNPLSISIDPIIREIFLGKFLIDSPSLKNSVRVATAEIVSLENK